MNDSPGPVIYGIKNCDTIKKARAWMNTHHIDYRFHDYRVEGIDAARLLGWCTRADWQTLLNRRGTTWRKLPEAQRENIDQSIAIALMCEYPAMIKRPVLEARGELLIGFDVERYKAVLQ